MRKSETEANIWWVALVTALVGKGVDRAADTIWPPNEHARTEECGCAANRSDDTRTQYNEAEITQTWNEMQAPVCLPARQLLESHLLPAPYQGARRKPQFRLSLSAEQNDPAEQALYNLQSFILLVGALLSAGAISLAGTCRTFGKSAREWRELLARIIQRDRSVQLPFDLTRLEELLRAVAVLKLLEDSKGRSHAQGVSLQNTSIEKSDDGKFVACGQLHNPNDFAMPSAAICIEYIDRDRQPAGHLVVWPTTLEIGPRECLDFYNPLPTRSGLKPIRFRLALSAQDFCATANRNSMPQSGTDLFHLLDELTRLLKR